MSTNLEKETADYIGQLETLLKEFRALEQRLKELTPPKKRQSRHLKMRQKLACSREEVALECNYLKQVIIAQ